MTLSHNCPGSKLFKEIRPEYIACPHCGAETELWSDELVIRCKSCGGIIAQKRGASCIDWCRFAKECIGAQKWERLQRETAEANAILPADQGAQ
jgi:DNA-directed RNA polymerase subunit RPC12/RpoP